MTRVETIHTLASLAAVLLWIGAFVVIGSAA